MTFVDVGAHLGYYSLLASRLVGPGGRVLALEPAPQTLELLAHNLRECPNATVVAAAAFSRSGPMTFNDLGLEYSAFSSYTRPRMDFPDAICTAIEVCGVRLDDLLADAPGAPMFVKIDAESAEAQVIEGMAATLERRRPMVSVEIGDVDLPGVVPSRQVVDQLLGLGYRVFEYGSREEPLRPHVPRERYDYDNLVFLP
jgi:FkbM family methyltransferase